MPQRGQLDLPTLCYQINCLLTSFKRVGIASQFDQQITQCKARNENTARIFAHVFVAKRTAVIGDCSIRISPLALNIGNIVQRHADFMIITMGL